ncbi:sugar phosphate isomerase/epimerase family protein [Flavisolibacter ginsengisoli]|jgi:sugar phosphate isomerase/epimerase|uniref:Sugar phosphate isomerase/epimerase n=1 Tax=Flavisolibacter ginsengisoli DSM 18119 TaxID=1121884 RepID=A0A1M5ERE4_9BACT|nr:sugar phosphate isomerase/epimerase family protein [Flavisolibacter ginsengisoli]SHF81582.1 Sugar phosphate isomerase/epimerase [Flavisolibacter ginsengisoli DSM 18119]
MSSRREFLTQVGGATALGFLVSACSSSKAAGATNGASPFFYEMSLAEWSLHKALFANKITNLDFPGIAKKQYGISVVEYVNQFFKDKANDTKYLGELLTRCKDNGVTNHLIMCDGEGSLGDPDAAKRKQAVENHYKWVDAAKFLGCRTIRVNAFGDGSAEDVQKAAIESLSQLGEYAGKENINVIVENHGHYTSDGNWMVRLMKGVNRSNVGVLPDFNNFCVKREGGGTWSGKCIEEYDRYKGVKQMMPYAKGASAKTIDFDANGNCVETDYVRMLQIIKDSGFKGYIGIEYEGEKLSEDEGIRKTKALLEKVTPMLS